MNGSEVMDIAHDAVWTIIAMTAPVMLVAMFIGVIIAFLQALTQIQEVTLTFVPKILAVFFMLLVYSPKMGTTLQTFTEDIFDKISNLNNAHLSD